MKTLWVAALIAGFVPLTAAAVNGLNLIGYGTESSAMGGADTAVARDTTALNTNPAGLGQTTRPVLDGYLSAAIAVDIGHRDKYGNDSQVDNRVIPMGGLGLARPAAGGRLVWGLGFFAQGGAGAVYEDLRTPFGTTDELSAQIGIVRLSPGLAWRVDERLSVGVALPLNVIIAKQRVFPNTSVLDPADPSRSFFGSNLRDAHGMRLGLRWGLMWKPSADWTYGASFSPRVKLDATDGEVDVNMSAVGLGVVHYRDARVEGFALPREIALGAAWQATPRTLLSVKLAHLDWSHALQSLTVSASEPDNPAAPATLSQTSAVNWRDQVVVALGLAYRSSDRLTVYAGFNDARNPTPRETMSPLLAAIGSRHVTGGFALRVADGWVASGALEYQFSAREAYDNPHAPLGEGAEERNSNITVHVMLSRAW